MTKSQLIEIFEKNLQTLKSSNIPEEIKLFHNIDTGGYGGDISEISDFDIALQYDKEDNIMYLSYYGDETFN